MQKCCRALARIAGNILILGITVQILFGLCWIVRSFRIFPEFGDSYLWLKAAETFCFDDYMGIGYPLFLMLAKGIESLCSIPYTFFVYTVQLVVALLSGYVFLHSFGVKKRGWLIWGSLGLITFPMALQCHLAVLPNSLAFSCILFELAAVIRVLRGVERPLHQLFVAGLWWGLATLLLIENRYIGVIPLLFLWIAHGIRRKTVDKKTWGGELLLILAMGGILFTIVPLWQTPGAYGRVKNTASAAMMRRFAWTNFRKDDDFEETFPVELQEILTWDDVEEDGRYAGYLAAGSQKLLEDRVGSAEAERIFRAFAAASLKEDTKAQLHWVAWDAAGYVMPPVILRLLLDGRGYDSYSGRNVDIMMTGDLELTDLFLRYSSWWYLVGTGVAVLYGAGYLVWKKRTNTADAVELQKQRSGNAWGLVCCALTALGMVAWYTMQDAGCLDYKNGLLPGSLWGVLMLLVVYRQLETEKRETAKQPE